MKKRIFCLFLVSFLSISALFYYFFHPRLKLGYSDTKISLYQWRRAFPREPHTETHLYHYRFDKDYYYKAYRTYWYYTAALHMGMAEEQNPLYKEMMLKISYAYINENDIPMIETLHELYRSSFLKQLQHFKTTTDHFSKCEGPGFISYYFILYSNHITYGCDIDNNEFNAVFQWLTQYNEQYKELMKDPMGIQNTDFRLLTDPAVLRTWIDLKTCAEFVLDTDKYEILINNFNHFIISNFTTNKDK